MKRWGSLLGNIGVACLLGYPAFAQIKAIDLNEEGPAGDALRILSVGPAQNRVQLLTKFVDDFPTHSAASWAWRQIAEVHLESKDLAKASPAAEKVMATNPEDLDIFYRTLKLAEEKQDSALVRKWADTTETVAKRISGDSCARKQLVVPECEQAQEFAKQVLPYMQYLRYVEILKIRDAKQRLTALEAFLKDCPQSEYERQGRYLVFYTHAQLGDTAKAYQSAVAYLRTADDNDDMLLLVAERQFQEGRDREKTLQMATRALQVAETKPKPEEMDAAAFERQRSVNVRRAHWMIGRIASDLSNYRLADQHLRAALPALKGDSQMLASALFQLGWANYKMGNFGEALKFNQMCAAIPGTHQDGARRNLQVIQSEMKQ